MRHLAHLVRDLVRESLDLSSILKTYTEDREFPPYDPTMMVAMLLDAYRRPVGLTITVEKIDHVLADVQAQIEWLLRERINLGLVRRQLVSMEAQWRGE